MIESEVRNIASQLNNDPVVEFIWDSWYAMIGTTQGETSVGMLGGAPEQARVAQVTVSRTVPAPGPG
jgi:hypothetical protein